MIIDYNQQSVFTKSLDIVDLGNTAIRATTENGLDYYIAVKTIMGKTAILKFGPIMADVDVLLDSFNLTYQKIDYKEATIIKIINMFINDTKKKIFDAVEITELEMFEDFPDIEGCFSDIGGDE